MGLTLAEKIISLQCGQEVKAGQTIISPVSLSYFQDGTGPLGLRQIQKLGCSTIANPARSILFIDHSSPSPRKELSNDHVFLREFAKSKGIILHDVGDGVCHQVVAEKYIKPGDVVIGADSHTCMGGAFAAFSTGMGSTDVAVGMSMGKTWFRIPETFKILLKGQLPNYITTKDIILHLISMIGADGATYKSLEFSGETVNNMSMPDRLTISNMAVEAGAKLGLFASDQKTYEYMELYNRPQDYKELLADSDAEYEKVIEINVNELLPTVSFPHTVDNTRTIDKITNVPVHQVFIGTCTNGRIEDIRQIASILKGRKVSVRTIITPASKDVFIKAAKEGLVEIILESGATITSPGCGACVGVHGGILGDDENCISTQNRNFQGRMGNPKGNIYLSSPLVAAASAVVGEIADPRLFLN